MRRDLFVFRSGRGLMRVRVVLARRPLVPLAARMRADGWPVPAIARRLGVKRRAVERALAIRAPAGWTRMVAAARRQVERELAA